MGHAVLAEVPLGNGRRADLVGLDRQGRFSLIEVKSSRADFLADHKWQDYGDWCDAFYFAVDAAFPRDLLPAAVGVIVADAHDAVIVRPSVQERSMASARRRSLTVRFARLAAVRLAAAVEEASGVQPPLRSRSSSAFLRSSPQR